MRVAHFVVPNGIDDPAQVSGGNVYDRRVRDGLRSAGWDVRMAPVVVGDDADVAAALGTVPEGGVALVDGLVACRAPGTMEAAAGRATLVVLAHMVASVLDAEASDGERRALAAARLTIATSTWTRAELVRRGLVDAGRIEVALPGSDAASPATGTTTGGNLLCVGVVARHKGHDLLVRALAGLGDVEGWSCTIAGSTSADPVFARSIASAASDAGIGHRVALAGVLADAQLERAYASADLLVAPSRAESYGMAIGDALRHGVPVVASAAGGIPQSFGHSPAVVLLPPGEPAALGLTLRTWMVDPALRQKLKAAATQGGAELPSWRDTVDRVAAALGGVA